MQARKLAEQRASRAWVAATVRRARESAGLSLRALAWRVGTSHPTLLAYEQGRKAPSAERFVALLEACDVAVHLEPTPRIRSRDGLDRGEELAQALALAEAFPVAASARTDKLRYPPFPRS